MDRADAQFIGFESTWAGAGKWVDISKLESTGLCPSRFVSAFVLLVDVHATSEDRKSQFRSS